MDESELPLFQDRRLLFLGSFSSPNLPTVSDLTDMLEDAGADVLTRLPKKRIDPGPHADPLEDLIVIIDRGNADVRNVNVDGFRTVLDCSWLVDSISSYRLLEIKDYRVNLNALS
jgi:hypothetical protein